ncbi:hypothetical protein DFH29DRAFT_878801 [Suillus ampliporus]|nr:hypothetical protein DFH29DRAFT_878801 [Suillus ampliporus]
MHASFFTGRLVALAAIASAVVDQSNVKHSPPFKLEIHVAESPLPTTFPRTSWQQSTAASLTPLDDLFIGEARHFTFEEHLDELERLSAGSELELLVMDIGPELRADTFDSIREGGLFTGVAWDMLIFWTQEQGTFVIAAFYGSVAGVDDEWWGREPGSYLSVEGPGEGGSSGKGELGKSLEQRRVHCFEPGTISLVMGTRKLISHQTLLCFAHTAAVSKNLRQFVVVFVGKGKEGGLDRGVKRMGLIFCSIGR